MPVLTSEKEKSVHDYSSPTDPYSPNLAYFFKQVAPNDPQQYKLMVEYSQNEHLQPLIRMHKTASGTLLKFSIRNQELYDKRKKELNL